MIQIFITSWSHRPQNVYTIFETWEFDDATRYLFFAPMKIISNNFVGIFEYCLLKFMFWILNTWFCIKICKNAAWSCDMSDGKGEPFVGLLLSNTNARSKHLIPFPICMSGHSYFKTNLKFEILNKNDKIFD